MGGTTDDSFMSESPLSPNRLRNMAVLARLRLMADYVDYLWFKNVVSFGEDEQQDCCEQDERREGGKGHNYFGVVWCNGRRGLWFW